MKLFKLVFAVTLLVVVSATTGCATNNMKIQAGDVEVLAGPDMRSDRLVTKTSEFEGTIEELTAHQVLWKNPDGSIVVDPETGQPMITRLLRESRTTPFGGQVLVNTIPGVATAIVQGEYAKEVAEENACKGDICNSTVILNEGSQAAALSGSESNASSSANVSGCSGSACLGSTLAQ